MTPEQILDRCRELVAQPLGDVAERWKEANPGGRVVAMYPVWAPAEVVHAAGMLPLALLGGGVGDFVEPLRHKGRCGEGFGHVRKGVGLQRRREGGGPDVFADVVDAAQGRQARGFRNGLHVAHLSEPFADDVDAQAGRHVGGQAPAEGRGAVACDGLAQRRQVGKLLGDRVRRHCCPWSRAGVAARS